MRVDVRLTPPGLNAAEVQGRTVFVIDILRATTTMCAALSHGAKAIIPVASTEEALRLAQTIGSADVLLAGEQNCVKIPGFQLGNSPLEMTESAVRGKTIIVSTSNLTAAVERAREALETDQHFLVVCAGRSEAFSLDDAYCAGRLVAAVLGQQKPRRGLNDAAIACLDLVRRYGDDWGRPLARCRAGRELIKLGFSDDLRDASRVDAYPVLPHFHERRVTLVPVPV
jgi:2-phosphosulfolactate phosphatase